MQWLVDDAPRLLDARNRRDVDYFKELIEAHQQLVFRSHGMQASLSSLSASVALSASTVLPDVSTTAQKYLNTIQELEKELHEKNAQLARYAGNQLQLVNESKELLQERHQWEFQLEFFTKRLEEEMLLNEEKDRAMKDLNEALRLVRDELARHKELLDKTEQEGEGLRRRIRELEEQLLRKSQIMEEWLATNEPPDQIVNKQRGGTAGGSMATQEMAESVSKLFIDSGVKITSRVVTRVAHSIRAHATEVNSVCFNASGKVLFSGSSDGTVRAWEAASCRPMGEYRGIGTAHPLLCVRVSEDGGMVLGTGCDRKCFVWRVGTGRVFQTLTGHKGKVLAAEFSTISPNEVITGSSDRSMRVWDVSRGLSVQSINCRSSCNDVAMPVGGQFASAHHDGVVRFWDSRSKQMVQEVKDIHDDQVTSVSFARDGNRVLTNSRDNTLRVLDTRTFESVLTLKHTNYHTGFDWCKASLSPDGAYAAAGSSSGNIFLWNTISGKVEKELSMGHQGAVASCVWRPDGEGVASCDKNGVLVLWE
ncbi:hypothetical protein Poli38472_010399 [Pythium oligandrum]|uniref:Autophagy-related protein 16 domain-containing protein n=1 Tax=Pythium oligandrum TaxID=41045 RepID=A0A8K1FDF2_PYTOL|nr:hypothetical protein Poli38472_010399 [Pythium oligandrum]|eukprot:TMW55517.1 hypothetical protein Poli38472_010399 [Pythium oligandrum]